MRLCISPFDGSSRSTLLTTMRSSRSVNQPCGRNHVRVWTAEAGMRKNDAT
jgi:hypothetical protein